MAVSNIDSYALSLAFDLQDNATPKFDIIDLRLNKIETQITSIAQKTMGNMAAVTADINRTLLQMSQHYDKINASNLTLTRPLKDSLAITGDTKKLLGEESSLLKDKFMKTWEDIIKTLTQKNKLLREEHKLIQDEEKIAKALSKEMGTWEEHINKSKAALLGYLKSLVDVKAAVWQSVEAADMYKNANFRLYGSQTELVGRSNELGASYGIMGKEAREAIGEMSNLKVPNEMLNQLVETTVKFNRLSGVSIKLTSEWNKSLLASGSSAADVERATLHMTRAMRRFGLDTSDTTNIMQHQQNQATKLLVAYGPKMAGTLRESQVHIASFLKELGATPDVISSASAALSKVDPVRFRALGAAVNVSAAEMRTAEGQSKAFAAMTNRVADQLRGVEDETQRLAITMNSLGLSMGDEGLALAVNQAAATLEGQEVALGKTMNATEMMTDVLSKHKKGLDTISSAYDESNATIIQQLALLKNAFVTSIGAIWSKIEPFFVSVLQAVNYVVGSISYAIAKFGEWLNMMGPVGSVLKYIAIAVLVVAAAYIAWIGALHLFSAASALGAAAGRAFSSVIKFMFDALSSGLQSVASYKTTMLALAALIMSVGLSVYLLAAAVKIMTEQGWAGIGMLAALVIAVGVLGAVLVAIGKYATVASVGLYALAAVIVAVGVSAYLLALAVKMIADMGWPAVGALAALTVAIVIMAATIVIASGYIAVATPVIYAFAVALLMFGAAVLMAGAGAYLFATAIKIVVESCEHGVSAALALGAALAVFVAIFVKISLVASAAFPAMAALAGILLLLGVAAILVGTAVYLIGLSLKHMAEYGQAAAANLVALSGALIAMIPAIFAVSLAVVSTGGAFFVFAAALALIGIGAIATGFGLKMVSAALSEMSKITSDQSANLTKLSLAFGLFMVVLFGAAYAASFLVVPLLVLAGILAAIGIALFLAGTGAYLFGLGVGMIVQHASKLSLRMSFQLVAFAAALAAAGVILAAAAQPIMIAGVAVAVAGALFSIGMAAMQGGANILASIGPILAVGSLQAMTAGADLVIAATSFTIAGGLLSIAGTLMLAGAMALVSAGIALLFGSRPMRRAADALFETGQKMQIIGDGFMAAGNGLTTGVASIRSSIGSVRDTAREMIEVAPELNNAIWSIYGSLRMMGFMMGLPVGNLISNFDVQIQLASYSLYDTLDTVLDKLDQYGSRMSGYSMTIASAFRRIIPSFPTSMLNFVTKTEGFSNTPAQADSTEMFAQRNQKAEDQKLMKQNILAINSLGVKFDTLIDAVKKIGAGGITDLGPKIEKISDILLEYLPEMGGSGNSAMGTSMNEWMT